MLSSLVSRTLLTLLLAGVWLASSGCDRLVSGIPLLSGRGSADVFEHENPRAQASYQLTSEGRMLLESGQIDDAIGMFERSIGLDPNNGQNYYYLAEAWLMKGNAAQATEFNHLAGLYLQGDSSWMIQVMDQRARINRGEEQWEK